jgi:uncharacterized phiE125 gp8 family phage protein
MNYPYGYPYVSPYDSNFDSYGTLCLTETDSGQTFDMPLALEEVKEFLRISTDDVSQDITLEGMIFGAIDQAEILQNRDLFKKQWDLSYDYWPEYRIRLRAPCVSVDLMRYTDLTGAETTMVVNTDYVTDLKKQPGVVTPPWNRSWPAFTPFPSSAILVRFTSGYVTAAPFWQGAGARVKMGMKQLISSWFEQRLPFTLGARSDAELPFSVSSNLSYGALERVR